VARPRFHLGLFAALGERSTAFPVGWLLLGPPLGGILRQALGP
jgi:hypothetical protein